MLKQLPWTNGYVQEFCLSSRPGMQGGACLLDMAAASAAAHSISAAAAALARASCSALLCAASRLRSRSFSFCLAFFPACATQLARWVSCQPRLALLTLWQNAC